MRIFVFLLMLLIMPSTLWAENMVKATLLSDSDSIAAGKPLKLGVLLEAPSGWHTYWKDPGDAGLPTTLNWTLPEGFSASEIHWPTPTHFSEGNLTTNGYTGTTLLPVTLTVPTILNTEFQHFTVKADWLACNEICIPETQTLSLNLPVGTATPSRHAALFSSQKPTEKPIEHQQNLSFPAAIILALLGGLVLNLMPCVLPVLSLKALAIAKKAGVHRSQTIKHGIAYTLGILSSFTILAGILIVSQQAGESVGWGYQMQSPAFVSFLIFLLFLVGLNLSGVFHLPVILGDVNIKDAHSIRGSFFTGILATLVATPCTAPFMASAVGVAFTLPPWAAMAVFLSLGFGLALPFLVISIFPATLHFLPRPGAWMERFKEFLAFPMYGSVIWLVWVLGGQTGIGGIALVLSGLLAIVFILWLMRHRPIIMLITLFIIGSGVMFLLSREAMPEMNSVPYSKQTLSDLRIQGKAVYIDATAAWCITCQLNKHRALNTRATQAAFKEHHITLMIADWTRRSSEITEFLHGFGFNGVPLNVFYPANGGEAIVLPQILSESEIITTISQ